jgi:hypothetical protein
MSSSPWVVRRQKQNLFSVLYLSMPFCTIQREGLIGRCHIEEVGLIGVCHIEEVGLIGVCHIEEVGFVLEHAVLEHRERK